MKLFRKIEERKKNYWKEISFRIWLRIQIFKRYLLWYKNKNFFLKNIKLFFDNFQIFQKSEAIKKIFYKIKSKKSNEIRNCKSLAKYFIFKVGQVKRKTFDKSIEKSKNFNSKFKILKMLENENKSRTKEPVASLIGKTIFLEGTVIKLEKTIEHITTLLVECEKCGSYFFFVLEALNELLPFICNKENCSSKKFFPHFSRVLTENFQKLKLGKISINFKKQKKNESVLLNVYGSKNISFFRGLRIFCTAEIKLMPISKKLSSILSKKNLFNIQMHVQNNKNSIFKFVINKSYFFLTTSDFLFINKINSVANLFHLLIKNIQPTFCGYEGIKACLLLLASQQLQKSKECIYFDILNFCFIISENSDSNDFFIKKLVKFFPRCFILNFESFISQINNRMPNKSYNYVGGYLNLKNSIIFIDLNSAPYKNINIKMITQKIKNFLKKKKSIIAPSIIVLHINLNKKNNIIKSNQYQYFPRNQNVKNFLELIYILKKSFDKINGEIKTSQFSEHNPLKTLGLINLNHSCLNFKTSILHPLLLKKKISACFFKKYLHFVQGFPDSNLTTKSLGLLLNLYKKTRSFKIYSLNFSLEFLSILIKFSQCRAKIDLREQICTDDILDGLEIFLDSKPAFFKNLLFKTIHKKNKEDEKINLFYKFLRLLHKFFYTNGQTIFEIEQLGKNLRNKLKFSEILEIFRVFNMIKKIKINLISLNV